MRRGSREPQLLSQSDIDAAVADLLSSSDEAFTAAALTLARACINKRLSRQEARGLIARLLEDKDGLRRTLARLVDDGEKESQLAVADLLLCLAVEIKPALAALQPSQLVDVAAVVVDLVTWRHISADGSSRCYGPDESLAVKHGLKADAAADIVTLVRLGLLIAALQALREAAPQEGACLRDLLLAGHQTTIKQCLTVTRTDIEGSVSRTAFDVLKSLLLPFTPSPSSPDAEDPAPIPLQLSLPLFTLLVDHVVELAEGTTLMHAQGLLMALELPGLVARAASWRQDRSLREKDVKRLVRQHIYPHMETLLGIIASAQGGMLAVGTATVGAISEFSGQWDSPTHVPRSSCRPLLDNPSLIMTAIKAANAIVGQDVELPPYVYTTMLFVGKLSLTV
ncbi:unnamed protein product, partial [Vitrella brassicaformis CCMP3155]